jgi:hypothetical protein
MTASQRTLYSLAIGTLIQRHRDVYVNKMLWLGIFLYCCRSFLVLDCPFVKILYFFASRAGVMGFTKLPIFLILNDIFDSFTVH